MSHFIKQWREYRGLQQKDFAGLMGLGRPYVSMVENGNRRYDQKFLEKAAQVLNCTVTDLVGRPPGENEDITQLLANASPEDRERVEVMIRALLSHVKSGHGVSNSESKG